MQGLVIEERKSTAGRLAESLERDSKWWLGGFIALYFLCTATFAMLRPFWYDEIGTFFLSQLSSMSELRTAQLEGMDFNPPLMYVLMRASHAVFGTGLLATRLPSMLGFLTMCLCMYVFVARRCPKPFAFVALLLPVLTSGYYYAGEARPYGIELGFLGLAVVAWQSAVSEPRRTRWLVLLYASLAAALLSHVFAALALIPFGIAEAVRYYRSRRIDWLMMLCFAGLAPVLLAYLPYMEALKPQFIANAFQVTALTPPEFYGDLLRKAIWPMAGALVLANRSSSIDRRAHALPIHEIALVATFLLIPIFAMAARPQTGFFPRYGLAVLIGIGIAFAFYLCHATNADPKKGASAALLMAVSVPLFAAAYLLMLCESRPTVDLASIRPDLPIVISHGVMFLEEDQRQPPEVAARLRFLTDEAAGARIIRANVFDHIHNLFRKWFKQRLRGKIEDYDEFVAQGRPFLVYGVQGTNEDWLVRRLIAEGAQMKFLGEHPCGPRGSCLLLQVDGLRSQGGSK